MKYFKISLLIVLAAFSFNGNAQDIKVEAKLDKSSIMMGDQTILRLSVTLPLKSLVDFPALTDTLSSKVQIVKLGKTDTIPDKNNAALNTITRQYTITSFDPGLQMIPALSFKVADGNLNTNALPLQVNAVKVDTTKAIFDIKEPLAVKYSWVDWIRDHVLTITLTSLGIALIIGLIYYLAKRKKVKPVTLASKPNIPIHQLALEKLYALREQKLWQQDEMKRYYSEITDIVREYLEKRYQINAMEQTTEEIFGSLKKREIAEQDRNTLRQVLVLADLVKFAKEKPLNIENEQSMDNAIGFIKNTQVFTENKEQQ